ncbi:hypothetical protein [Ottowia thiooxydans]|uniref:hypothetical protein n=1 Tax=Ottowia thiooxydans TaxID=219182 RepID=UPI00040707E9|nr:hypothetical protein [Ottowia thiooxydans]
MSSLKLGAYNLPPAEVALIKTLFRLFSHGNTFQWTFVNAPPYDALLVDGTTLDAENKDLSRLAKAVLFLKRMNSGSGPNTLERPIRADQLQNWLTATEKNLRETLSSSSSHAPEPESELTAFPSQARFKLRRWPPAILLRGDATRIRMATILSRRALSVGDLSIVCQQPVSVCETFLQVLRAASLIDMVEQPVAETPAPASGSKAHASRPKFSSGLISSIRRRLGL